MTRIRKRELLARSLRLIPDGAVKALGQAFGRDSLVCLTYHRVGRPDAFDEGLLSCSYEELEWQTEWLASHIRVLNGSELSEYVRGELQLNEPAALVTFDDGYRDNLKAGQILASYKIPAVFFLTTGFVGSKTIPDWDRLAYAIKHTKKTVINLPAFGQQASQKIEVDDLPNTVKRVREQFREMPAPDQPQFLTALEQAAEAKATDHLNGGRLFMSWDEVKTLSDLGHTIGAHTHSHPILSGISENRQREEIEQSKRIIEQQLGVTPKLFAYPVGNLESFTQATKSIVRACGFDAAFSYCGGSNFRRSLDPYDIRRVSVDQSLSRSLFRVRVGLAYISSI